jgi:hypothetical protein
LVLARRGVRVGHPARQWRLAEREDEVYETTKAVTSGRTQINWLPVCSGWQQSGSFELVGTNLYHGTDASFLDLVRGMVSSTSLLLLAVELGE